MWTALIFFISTDLFSSAHTSTWMLRLMIALRLPLTHFSLIHAMLRKIGHLSGYAVLGALLFRAWRATLPARGWPERRRTQPAWMARWSLLAVVNAAIVASLDEFHQSFVPSRTASPRDVAIDTLGALFAQYVLLVWLIGRTQRSPRVTKGPA